MTDDKATPADVEQRDLVRELRHHHMRTGFSPFLEAATALAAERDRADRAEAALGQAWNQGHVAALSHNDIGDNPYRAEATA